MPRILSIEDDPDFQHLISLILRRQGYEIHYAFTGPEGHEKSLSLAPDLILLDMVLPGLNGVEVVKLLKGNKATRDIPIIALTAYPSDANFFESEIKALGAIAYLRKPVRAEEIVPLIKRLLTGSRPRSLPAVWKRGDFRLFPETKSVMIGGRMVANLAPKRFEVLFHLLQEPGELPWRTLVFNVWGRDGTKNDLQKTVQRLREDLGAASYRLSTTRKGYRLIV